MKTYVLAIGLLAAAQTAQAEDCSELGLDDAHLRKLICTELQEVIGSKPITRSITGNNNSDDVDAFDEQFPGIEVLKDAYRADPETTLELIERIRQAGGLLDN